jgi:hypothetical protein
VNRLAALVVCICAAGGMLAAQDKDQDKDQDKETITAALLVGRGAWYVDEFITTFSSLVAEETYVQDSSVAVPLATVGGRIFAQGRHRVLKSDFLLAVIKSTGEWVPFRDVFEVDAAPIRDRQQRLARLFLNPLEDALDQASRIQEEGARYNLGNMQRTINNPVFAFQVLDAEFQQRFRYSLGKLDPKAGNGVWIVDYKEDSRPTIVHGRANLDIFAHGRLWIEAETGRVLKTEVLLEQPTLRARITASFRYDPRFEIAVPIEMQEEYSFDNGTRVNAVATYANFRRFDVTTDESVKQ